MIPYDELPAFIRETLKQLFEHSRDSAGYHLHPKFLKWVSFARFKYPDPDAIAKFLYTSTHYLGFSDFKASMVRNAAFGLREEWSVSYRATIDPGYMIPLMNDYLKAIGSDQYVDCIQSSITETASTSINNWSGFYTIFRLSISFINPQAKAKTIIIGPPSSSSSGHTWYIEYSEKKQKVNITKYEYIIE